VHSIRAYPSIDDIRRMVSRTAYAQLRYSPLLLAGTVLGLAVTYIAPVALAVFATGMAQFLGIFTWLLMAFAFKPDTAVLPADRAVGLALPAIAAIYMAFTLDSAYQHARGRGGMWKAACKPTFRNCDERCGRITIGQGSPERKFSGGVLAY